MLSQNGGHLLVLTHSRLNPEIFFHPVWVQFGSKKEALSNQTIKNLLNTASELQNDDPASACQIYMLCAASQSHLTLYENALSIIERAWLLAKTHNLTKEQIWCHWGLSAINTQKGKYDIVRAHLDNLQAELRAQNEWVTASIVEVVGQYLQERIQRRERMSNENPQKTSSNTAINDIFDWLQNWGFSHLVNKANTVHSLRTRLINFCPRLFFPIKHIHRHKTSKSPSLQTHDTSDNIKTNIDIHQGSELSKQRINNKSNVLQPQSITGDHSSKAKPTEKQAPATIDLFVQMLGPFNLILQDSQLKLANTRGLSLLKYLLLNYKIDIHREILMGVFWPDIGSDAARNSLNVTVHSLRQALRSITDLALIRFENGSYGFEPNIAVWLDVEEFEKCIKNGRLLESQKRIFLAVTEYEIAINLYRGDFLIDNPYEGWTVLERERLRIAYLDTLDRLSQIYFAQQRYGACISLCQLILDRDSCREDAHCRLMLCYNHLGKDFLAIRQYQHCVEVLHSELKIGPAPETTIIYEQIRQHKQI